MKPSSPPQEQTSLFHQACSCDVLFTGQMSRCSIHDPLPETTTTTAFSGYVIPPYLADKEQQKAVELIQSFSSSVSRTVDHEPVSETIEMVYNNASDEWKTQATEILHALCKTRHSFDLDDVADALKPIDHLPHKPRAVGQLMLKARKNEWCRQSHITNSRRKSRHYGYIAVYTSLVHGS